MVEEKNVGKQVLTGYYLVTNSESDISSIHLNGKMIGFFAGSAAFDKEEVSKLIELANEALEANRLSGEIL